MFQSTLARFEPYLLDEIGGRLKSLSVPEELECHVTTGGVQEILFELEALILALAGAAERLTTLLSVRFPGVAKPEGTGRLDCAIKKMPQSSLKSSLIGHVECFSYIAEFRNFGLHRYPIPSSSRVCVRDREIIVRIPDFEFIRLKEPIKSPHQIRYDSGLSTSTEIPQWIEAVKDGSKHVLSSFANLPS